MIPSQLTVSYTTLAHELSSLKLRVDALLSAYAENQEGQYSSRVKSVDSIMDKAILGNYQKLSDIEDLFAATIVLPYAPIGDSLTRVQDDLSTEFIIREVRSNRTQRPSEFIYDDLHLILSLKDSAFLMDKSLLRWTFELQVKSYLQHAWAKAVHNTVYKASVETWRASRVAGQTRAAIEIIESVLAAGEDFLPDEVSRPYGPIDKRSKVIELIENWWHGELPANRRRLGIFAENFMSLAGISIKDLEILMNSERGEELQRIQSLSIQQVILVLLIEKSFDRIIKGLRQRNNKYLLITHEMEDLSEVCKEVPSDIRFDIDDED